MRSTLNLDDSLILQAKLLTGIGEKTKLIHYGLKELIYQKKLKELVSMKGFAKGKAKSEPRKREWQNQKPIASLLFGFG